MSNWSEILSGADAIKDLTLLKVTLSDLEEIQRLLETHQHVTYINWSRHTLEILNRNRELKLKIQNQLVRNLVSEKKLVFDLSKCELDQDYLNELANEVERNVLIGEIYLGEHNERQFAGNEALKSIEKNLTINNNDKYNQHPSDYIHCLLASHCRGNKIETVSKKISDLGWEIQGKFKVKNYLSILYRNRSTRQLVLAFRGLKLDVSETISDKNIKSDIIWNAQTNELTSMTYFAGAHTKIANFLSKEFKYSLSFTGYSFGGWLAEICVYFSHQRFENHDVKAVVFESPGSLEAIQKLHETNIRNQSRSVDELLPVLNIRSYLLSPNFVNTCNTHVGKVYRILDTSSSDEQLDDLDRFFRTKITGRLKNKLGENVDKWYSKARNSYSEFKFYLNGLRALFDDEIDWILKLFDPKTGGLKNQEILYLVYKWPRMNVTVPGNQLAMYDVKTWKFFSKFVFIPQVFSSTISVAIDPVMDAAIRSVYEKTLPNIIVMMSFIDDVKQNSNDLFKYDDEGFNNDIVPGTQEVVKVANDLKLEFHSRYQIRRANLRFDELVNYDPGHVDKHLLDFYHDYRRKLNDNRIISRFVALREGFTIDKEVKGWTQSGTIRSRKHEIDTIRERFKRLMAIDEVITKMKLRHEDPTHQTIDDVFGGKLESFVDPDEKLIERIDRILDRNKFAYIYGETGSGKSTLGIQYGHHLKERDNSFVIQFLKSESLSKNVLELKKRVFGESEWEGSSFRADDELRKVIREIEAQKVIFIIDSVDELAEVEILINEMSERHRLLVTTQNQDLFIKKDPERRLGVKIDPSNVKNLLEFLQNKGSRKSAVEFGIWRRLMKQHGYGTNSISFQTSDKSDSKPIEHPPVTRDDHFPSVYEKIKGENSLAFDMLKYFAYLDARSLDIEVVKGLYPEKHETNLRSSLVYLIDNSVLKENRHVDGDTAYEISEDNQLKIREALDDDSKTRNLIMNRLVFVLDSILGFEIEDMKKMGVKKVERINNHVAKLMDHQWEEKLSDLKLIKLLNKIEIVNFKITQDVEKSVRYLNRIVELKSEAGKNVDPLKLANLVIEVGVFCHHHALYNEALAFFTKGLDKLKELNPTDHQSVVNIMNDLIRNDVSMFRKDINARNLEVNFLRLLASIGKLGLHDLICLAEFGVILEKLVDIKGKTADTKNPDLARTIIYLGLIYQIKGNLESALEKYQEAVKILRGTDSRQVADVLAYMGAIYMQQSKYDEAFESFQSAVKMIEISDPQDSNLVYLLNQMGVICEHWEDHYDALWYYNKAVEILKKKTPEGHLDFAVSWDLIGDYYYKNRDFDKALDHYERAFRIRKENGLPDGCCEMAASYRNLGSIYRKRRDYQRSLEYYDKALEIKKRYSNFMDLSSLLNSIGIIYVDRKEYHRALEVYFDSLEIRRLALSQDHDDVAGSLINIGIIYSYLERYEESLETLGKALEIRERTRDPDHLFELNEFIQSVKIKQNKKN